MGVIVEFGIVKAPGEESDGVDFAVLEVDREDSVVGGVGLHNQLSVRDLMGKDRGMSEGLL